MNENWQKKSTAPVYNWHVTHSNEWNNNPKFKCIFKSLIYVPIVNLHSSSSLYDNRYCVMVFWIHKTENYAKLHQTAQIVLLRN